MKLYHITCNCNYLPINYLDYFIVVGKCCMTLRNSSILNLKQKNVCLFGAKGGSKKGVMGAAVLASSPLPEWKSLKGHKITKKLLESLEIIIIYYRFTYNHNFCQDYSPSTRPLEAGPSPKSSWLRPRM